MVRAWHARGTRDTNESQTSTKMQDGMEEDLKALKECQDTHLWAMSPHKRMHIFKAML